MTFKAGDLVALADQLGGHVVEVVDEYRPGIYQVRLPGSLNFAISTHVLQLVSEADVKPHLIEFRTNGWTIQHPLACRPKLFDCPVNRVAEVELTEPPNTLGVFEVTINDLEDRLLIGDRVGPEVG